MKIRRFLSVFFALLVSLTSVWTPCASAAETEEGAQEDAIT